jgi:histidine ammonia-lyase
VEVVLAIEALCAAQALELVPGKPGAGAADIHALVRARVEPLEEDRPPAPDIEALRELVSSGAVAAAVVRHAGE